MRRRLDLAMGLLGTPSLMFLDEPTTGLDPQSRIAMWRIIKGLGAGGTTVFLTTQYLDEAEQLADHIAILDKGEIVAQGTAEELKKMLSRSHIELKFFSGDDMQTAKTRLHEFESTIDEENLMLLVTTSGTVSDITKVLSQLENAVTVAEFALKQPTLEDVFLSIIGEDKNNEEAV
jgi:ABC-2 type transport system ATP-binding protein